MAAYVSDAVGDLTISSPAALVERNNGYPLGSSSLDSGAYADQLVARVDLTEMSEEGPNTPSNESKTT